MSRGAAGGAGRAPPSSVTIRRVWELLRAGVAGALATGADVGTLTVLVALFHVAPRAASVPALVVGGVVNFVGNRHFAFKATSGPLLAQAIGYAAVELVALALNGLLYDLVLRTLPQTAHAFWAVRLATSHLVFLGWSYPLWRRVFAPRTVAA